MSKSAKILLSVAFIYLALQVALLLLVVIAEPPFGSKSVVASSETARDSLQADVLAGIATVAAGLQAPGAADSLGRIAALSFHLARLSQGADERGETARRLAALSAILAVAATGTSFLLTLHYTQRQLPGLLASSHLQMLLDADRTARDSVRQGRGAADRKHDELVGNAITQLLNRDGDPRLKEIANQLNTVSGSKEFKNVREAVSDLGEGDTVG